MHKKTNLQLLEEKRIIHQEEVDLYKKYTNLDPKGAHTPMYSQQKYYNLKSWSIDELTQLWNNLRILFNYFKSIGDSEKTGNISGFQTRIKSIIKEIEQEKKQNDSDIEDLLKNASLKREGYEAAIMGRFITTKEMTNPIFMEGWNEGDVDHYHYSVGSRKIGLRKSRTRKSRVRKSRVRKSRVRKSRTRK